MYNLHSMTTTTEAVQRLVSECEGAMRNMPPLYAIYPDYTAPIIKQRSDNRVLGSARWGLLSLKDPVTEKPNRGNSNVRRPWINNWREYLRVETGAPCHSIALPSQRSFPMAPAGMHGLPLTSPSQ